MSTNSLKTELLNSYSSIDLGKGILKSLMNDFYKSNPGKFPYKSIKTLLKSLKWPKSYYLINENGPQDYKNGYQDYPSDREPGWSHNLQGVTNDGKNWFFTQQEKLWKFPVERDLNDQIPPTMPTKILCALVFSLYKQLPLVCQKPLCAYIPVEGYDHFGDLDYYNGHLYVPLEDSNGVNNAKLVVFETQNLTFKYSAPLSQDKNAPWCAINPFNGLLYSSKFDIDNNSGIYVYDLPSNENNLTLNYKGQFKLFDEAGLPLKIERVQGGVFSKNGHLYLVSDTENDGILGFDMITGRIKKRIKVYYNQGSPAGDNEELEGITIWPLDSGQASGIKESQIHLIMIDNDSMSYDDL